ncbi:glycoside hydrolase family 13 protein [Pseudoramibacter alactolyticus]|uniref:glycoside hydrolase family 13 protein n=1 Tax=Pseudoramibacter alactolyticus TaxID=113287 RepID=UPI0028F05BB1|nr:glycoside hydrolase family 13 protein [Pseudoramibacter alactolyticus]
MYFKHDSFDLKFREPFGALPSGSRVTISVEAQDVMNIQVHTFFKEREHHFDLLPGHADGTFTCSIEMPKDVGLFWYDFSFDAFNKHYYYGPHGDNMGGEGRIYETSPPSFQITLYDDRRKVPEWYTDGIMYQIFPDRFAKGKDIAPEYFPNSLIHGSWNDSPHYFRREDGAIAYWDYFGGNLAGITEKLDYLKQFHVTILYLNPIFEANSNHKYNTADYSRIAREFGDESSFKTLCREAKKRGMHIILDGVFSHTGDDSIYFNKYGHYPGTGAYQSKKSPYYSWYRFSDYPDEYESWWGIGNMPNVEELDPAYQAYIFGDDNAIVRKWTRAGAAGWRLDVADELPDAFIEGLKTALMEEGEEHVLIGEVWENASNKISYGVQRQYFMGRELDSVMNYPFREAFVDFFLYKITSGETMRRMMSLYETYPRGQFMANMNLIGSHDRARILTVLSGVTGFQMSEAGKEAFHLAPDQRLLAVKRLKLISLVQMTFPGVPCIYYGDEAGMEGFEDPYNRGPYPWGREDRELITWYQNITRLRARNKPLVRGRFYPMASDDDLLVYLRIYKQTVVLCLFNRSDSEYKTYKHASLHGRIGRDLLGHLWEKLDGITLAPLTAKIYRLQTPAHTLFKNDREIQGLLSNYEV